MQLDVIATSGGLAELREAWEDLERRDPHASYYVTYRCVAAWWTAHADRPDLDLHVARISNNGKVVGIAPLAIRTRRGQSRRTPVLQFAGSGDYLGPILDPDASAGSVCKILREHVESGAGWDRVNLGNIPAYSPWAHHLLKSAQNPSFVPHVECPYVDLARFGDLETFDAHGLPAQLRNRRNKFYRECKATFRVWRGDEDDILSRIADLHRREKEFLVRDKARSERYSLFEDPARLAHVRALFTGTDDAVTLGFETRSGELIGYVTCFEHRRTMLAWNSAYHPDYEQYRIGKVLHYEAIAYLFDAEGVDRFDFGAGRYTWKFEWTGAFNLTYRWQLNLRPTSGGADGEDRGAAADRAGTRRTPAQRPAPRRPERRSATEPSAQPPVARAARRIVGRLGLGRIGRLGRSARARLRPPTIWYVPHPDDETIFMGGSIRLNRERRNLLVVLSRGGGSGALALVNAKLTEPLSTAEFMEARLREFRAAALALGVRGRDVRVHDLPDGGIEVADVHAIMVDLAGRFPGATHRTMSYLDPHPDHRNTGLALRQAYDEGTVTECLFHIPVPLVEAKTGAKVEFDEDAMAAKRAALGEYQRWEPDRGRYGVGSHSVAKLIKQQTRNPRERIHGPDYRR